MNSKAKKIICSIFTFIIAISATLFSFRIEIVSASEVKVDPLVQKISKDFTKKFCNSIAFGLSKESAMKFSLEENKKVFEKRKGINNINKDDVATEIANSVIFTCGYPINLSGEEGEKEFKNFYLSKEN